MSLLKMLVELACSIISLTIFSLGIILAVFELSTTAIAVLATGIGLIGLFISTALWLSAPRCLQQPFKRRSKTSISDGHMDPRQTSSRKVEQFEITPDTTEVIMKSIRGIPFLMQAIQYSLETSYYTHKMSESGQPMFGNSVIHTAPGCTSVLDCDSDDETLLITSSRSPRFSGPEELWESTSGSGWTNQQLKLSLNRRNSSLLVFPYSENRPFLDSFDDSNIGSSDHASSSEEIQALGASSPSPVSRVAYTTATTSQGGEIRCIGMSSVLLTRFNSSFKAHT
uniref:Uncharacterized protein n=1 Tax=Acrobeloides nanus TaxID=290746 RepID=A0A914DKM8_9BILA